MGQIDKSKPGPAYPLRSLEKTILILEALKDSDVPLGITELSDRLDLTVNAVHRHLDTLHWHDLIEQDRDTQKYTLGIAFIDYGSHVIRRLGFGAAVRPYLEQLVNEVKETINLSILHRDAALFIDKIESEQFLRLVTSVGTRVPLYCTGMGKAMLAYLPVEVIDRVEEEGGLKAYTPNTITDRERLLEELEKIRSRGFAIDREEYLEGVLCVAAPIMRVGEIKASLSASGPIHRMTPEKVEIVAPLVVKFAKLISEQATVSGMG